MIPFHAYCSLLRLPVLLATLLAVLAVPVAAQPAFVIDSLWVGVYSEKSTDSELKQIIQTGEQVEVLATEQGWARIALRSAGDGWVDQSYLGTTPPISTRISLLEQEISGSLEKMERISRQLKDFEQMISADTNGGTYKKYDFAYLLVAVLLLITAFLSGVAWRNSRLRRKFGGLLP